MRTLGIDIETFSSVDIGKAGSYRYAQSEDFEILLFAYKYDDEPTIVIDLANGEDVPEEVVRDLYDPLVVKRAYNAAFEIYCLNQAGYYTPINQWTCTMVHGLYCGYPSGLSNIGKAIGLPEEKQKMAVGKALIRYFCIPCKPTKTNGGRTRNLPHHDPDKWRLFKEYNAQDVDTEYEIEKLLSRHPMPDYEWGVWHEDIAMNTYGVKIDRLLVSGALTLSDLDMNALVTRAKEITGIDNVKSNAQVLTWLQSRLGSDRVPSANKATVASLLEEDIPDDVREFLELRQMMAKTSVTKYDAMARSMSQRDDRVRGLIQYYGANRTGRYAGRLVQVQNLPRNYLDTLDEARTLVKNCNYEAVKMIYGNVPDTLSQLIRTAFIPSDGGKFIVSDFSAIEARVIAWLAKEEWRQKTFAEGGDIYCASASQMFGVPVVKNGVNGHLRQKGKVAELALGYQGGVGALKTMGALDMGIPESELQGIVNMWRQASPNIVKLWYEVQEAAFNCITYGGSVVSNRCVFELDEGCNGNAVMTIRLPSGRQLFYISPDIGENRFGSPSITHMGQNQTTKKWERMETYGGKLVENIVQAIARDCLVVTMMRLIDEGYRPVMHIHDEVVLDATMDEHLDDVNEIFARPIEWANGLILKGAGFEGNYYMKD